MISASSRVSMSSIELWCKSSHRTYQEYIYRFNLTKSPNCKVCRSRSDSLKHVLLNCTSEENKRAKIIFKLNDQQESMHQILTNVLAALIYKEHYVSNEMDLCIEKINKFLHIIKKYYKSPKLFF